MRAGAGRWALRLYVVGLMVAVGMMSDPLAAVVRMVGAL